MATAIPRPTRPVANDASPPSLPALPVARTRQSSRTTTALLPALSTPSPRLPERSLSRTVANPAALDDTPGGGVPLPAPSSILKPNTSPVIAPGKWLSKSNALSSPQSSIGSVRRTTSARSSLTPRTSVRAPSYTTAPRAMSQSASPSNGASSGSATPSPQPIGGTRTASDESSTPTLESMQDEHAINEIAELEAPADLSTACDPAPLAVNSASQEKGNVIVSVRVRPELGGPKYRGGGSEWWIDGEEATISYRGRESGEYTYGKCLVLTTAKLVLISARQCLHTRRSKCQGVRSMYKATCSKSHGRLSRHSLCVRHDGFRQNLFHARHSLFPRSDPSCDYGYLLIYPGNAATGVPAES